MALSSTPNFGIFIFNSTDSTLIRSFYETISGSTSKFRTPVAIYMDLSKKMYLVT